MKQSQTIILLEIKATHDKKGKKKHKMTIINKTET